MSNPYEPPRTKPLRKRLKKGHLSPLETAVVLLITIVLLVALAWKDLVN